MLSMAIQKKSSQVDLSLRMPRCWTITEFKSAILNMSKDLKEIMSKTLKENMRIISQKIKTINENRNYRSTEIIQTEEQKKREMVIIKKTRNKNTGEDGEKRESLCTVRRNVNWCTTMENILEVPQKIQNRTTIASNNATSEYISKGNGITMSKRYLQPQVHCSIIYKSQDMEIMEMSIRWIKTYITFSLSIYI